MLHRPKDCTGVTRWSSGFVEKEVMSKSCVTNSQATHD